MRVHVQNFQSIQDATVDVDGFTVVTGTNNCGKSALVRAIRGAFQNAPGTSYIRNGKPKARVEIVLNDGHTLVWEKGREKGDKPTYIVDGGAPLHPGKMVPDEVRDLGVKPILAGGREIWPQFAPQFTGQVFLLDQPGSVLAEAVADVDRVSQLNNALRSSESDRRAAAAELKIRLLDKDKLTEELARYDGLDACQAEVEAIEKGLQKAATIEKAHLHLLGLQEQLSASRGLVALLSGVEEVYLPDADAFGVPEQCRVELEVLQQLRDRQVKFLGLVAHLERVEGAVEPDPILVEQARQDSSSLEELAQLQLRLQRAQKLVGKLTGIEAVADPSDGEAIERYLTALTFAEDLRRKHQAARQRILDLNQELEDAERQETEVETELSGMLGAWGECPVCGTAFSTACEHE